VKNQQTNEMDFLEALRRASPAVLEAALKALRGNGGNGGNGDGTKKKRKKPSRFKGCDHWLTRAQVQAVIEAEPDQMYKDIFRVAVSHGLRVSEVLGLRRDNIERGILTVQRLKRSRLTRQVLLVNLDAYINAPTYRLFPCSRSSVYLHFRKAAERVGLHSDLRMPHTLKHTCAHWMLDGGANLATTAQWLGHNSLSSTSAYLQVSDMSASTAAESIIGSL